MLLRALALRVPGGVVSRAGMASQRGVRSAAAAGPSRIAILIDADNVPARLTGPILEEIQQHVQGVAVDRRCYGDFSLARVEGWKLAALEHGIETKMQASPSKTKNATDIALCIDAMDILHSQADTVDTFVIVTNDGDFAPLAQRLRRSGKRVVAVGTGSSLVASCDSYVHVDFARSPTPSQHTAADVSQLQSWLFDAVAQRTDAAAAGDGERSAPRSRWVDLTELARYVDAQRPGWRRSHMSDFINFRHMLESEPYRDSFELRRMHRGKGRQVVGTEVQLRPHAHYTIDATRVAERIKRAGAEEGEAHAAKATARAPLEPSAKPVSEQPVGWFDFNGWFGGKAEKAEPSAPPAAAASSAAGGNGGGGNGGGGNGGNGGNGGGGNGGRVAAPLTEADASFMLDVLRKPDVLSACTAATSPEQGRSAPEGAGWMHLSPLAQQIDQAADETGRGRHWRLSIQPKGGFKEMLTDEQMASALEVVHNRTGPSTVETWVRVAAA